MLELQGLVEVLNRMLERLERASEWHRRIIRDLGHDLRTPIATIRAEVEMALSRPRPAEDYRRALVGTLEEIERLIVIGDALALLGGLEAGDLKAVLQEGDVRLFVGQAVERARARIGAQPVHYTSPSSPAHARADPRLLAMAVDQLIDNARRHTPPGTPVEVALGASDGWVTISVEDHGPGVPEEMLPHLFERFYRGDSARGRNAGPGLGLTTAAAIVDLHRGRISAGRGRMGGLRVELAIPADS